jgi:hypothetical protein
MDLRRRSLPTPAGWFLARPAVAHECWVAALGRARTPIHFSNSPSHSRDAILRPSFASLASLTPIEGWAERRESFGCSAEHPLGLHMTRQARRLARRLASHDAGRSPLGAPPWRFFTRGRASVSGMTRTRRANSSQPGCLASDFPGLPGRAVTSRPPQDATPRSAFRIVSRTRPQ